MKTDIDMNLVHDGHKWIARHPIVNASGQDFSALDANLVHALQSTGQFSAGTSVNVFMGFDIDTIPTWLRQYASHYFNRYVSLDL